MVLQVAGRLDSQASVALLGSLQKLAEDGDHEIVIDFEKLEAVSSEGLAALIQSQSRLRNLNGDLRIANVHGAVLDVFKLVHFDRLFELHPNIEAAIKQFALDRENSSQKPDESRTGDNKPSGKNNDA